jgi:DNA-binding HxlR family transcriptional regulator
MTPAKARANAPDSCTVRLIHLDRLKEAKEAAPAERELSLAARIFKALGDPTRLKILTGLRGGEMCVCDLAAFTGVSESAMSHQLRRLKDLNLVKPRRKARCSTTPWTMTT